MSKLFVLIAVSLWSSVAADSYLASVQPTHILKETETCEFVCRDQGQDCVWMGLEEEVCQLLLQSLTEPREPHQQEAYFILNELTTVNNNSSVVYNCSCSNTAAGVVYTCVQGYTGETCDTDVDECLSSLCQNSATCVDGANGYTCSCMRGYVGTHCETAVVDSHDCTWHQAAGGEVMTCAPGYVHVGACGSNISPMCGVGAGVFNEIKCCRTVAAMYGNAVFASGVHGEDVYCPDNKIALSTCGSGQNPECNGHSTWVRCQASTLNLGSCQWYYNYYGDRVECPPLSVMAGTCGTGTASNCNTHYGHGVYCCWVK